MKYFSFLLFFLFLISCRNPGRLSEGETVVADSIISRDSMVLILVDTHLAEAALIRQRNEGKENPALARYYYGGIFNKYRISQARFNANLTFYRTDPGEFSKMYEEVIARITERQKNYTPKK